MSTQSLSSNKSVTIDGPHAASCQNSVKSVSFSQNNEDLPISTDTESTNSLKCTTQSSHINSVTSKVFHWNPEELRHNSEYAHKNFEEPHNNFAQHLNVIGGLGPMKCIKKMKRPGKVVNRLTQVERISHTTKKVLPNFSLTEQLKPIVCPKPKHYSMHENIERTRLAENLPIETSDACGSDIMKSFKHKNPFNLDLKMLSEYQKQRCFAQNIQRRRQYQILKRTMETLKLRTEGEERIKQEERDIKFGLPAFCKVIHSSDEEKESGDVDFTHLFFFKERKSN